MYEIRRLLRELPKAEHMLAQAREGEKALRWWRSEYRRLTMPQTPPPRP